MDTSTTTPSSPIIVTSGDSRATTSANLGKLNDTTSKIQNATGASDPSVVNFLSQQGKASDFTSRSQLAMQFGIQGYTGSSQQNTQLLGLLQSGAGPASQKMDTAAPAATPIAATGQGGQATPPPAATGPAPAPTDTLRGDKAGKTALRDPSNADPLASDPAFAGYQQQITEANANLETEKNDAKTALDKLTATSDAATLNLINSIKATYEERIKKMQDSNSILLGSYRTQAYRDGGTRYAAETQNSFLSDQEAKATSRLSALTAEETQLIVRAQQAHDESSISAFNNYMGQLGKLNKEKVDNLTKLASAAQKATQEIDAQAKQAATEQKTKFDQDQKLVKLYASKLYGDIAGMSAAEKTQHYADVARDLDVAPQDLEAGVAGYERTATKAELANTLTIARTQRLADQTANDAQRTAIVGRKSNAPAPKTAKPKAVVDGTLKTTHDHVELMKSFFQNGDPEGQLYGTPYNPRGADGKVDPDLYLAVYRDWTKAGGTLDGFVKQFPAKSHLNPSNATRPEFKMFFPTAKKAGGA